MTVGRGVQAVVLTEDLQGWVFIRRLLITLGVPSRRIRVLPYPADGRGCGEQFVRETYPKEVRAYRQNAAASWLVVHIDADVKVVSNRYQQLTDACAGEGVAQRLSNERIAILVPKREIETWIHYLSGSSVVSSGVDETQSYPKFQNEESCCWPAAEKLAAVVLAKSGVAGLSNPPPSLVTGIDEVRRLLA